MNSNYHYYTIKTLAHFAGFDNRAAQTIAHFSQQVDHYILSSPFIVGEEPPDFFLKNGLAHRYKNNKWIFSPCPTGINMLSTVSRDYQLHTLMPFHFIVPVAGRETVPEADRNLLRCVTSGERDGLLIDRLMGDIVRRADVRDEAWLVEFGILLHTYADTYAHCHFSGFHGWENEAYVAEMTRNQTSEGEMKPVEIAFYRTLPPIGHGNVGHAPDYCDCSVTLCAKRTRESPLTPLIRRNNTDFFAGCSKRVYMTLCEINGRKFPGGASWAGLQSRLAKAQNIRNQNDDKAMRKNWSKVFPEVRYHNGKAEFMKLSFSIIHHDEQLINRLNATRSHLTDAYSEEGDRARAVSLTHAKQANGFFYLFNELAYRHVRAVTGEYASAGGIERLASFRQWAENI